MPSSDAVCCDFLMAGLVCYRLSAVPVMIQLPLFMLPNRAGLFPPDYILFILNVVWLSVCPEI